MKSLHYDNEQIVLTMTFCIEHVGCCSFALLAPNIIQNDLFRKRLYVNNLNQVKKFYSKSKVCYFLCVYFLTMIANNKRHGVEFYSTLVKAPHTVIKE